MLAGGLLGRFFLVWGILRRTFGFTLRPAAGLALLCVYHVVVRVGMALDRVLFPGLRRRRLDRPIFVVGAPRSGTTFVHRFLCDAGIGCGHQVWHILLPSLTLRALARPIVPWLSRRLPRFSDSKAHDTSLTSVETDDALVFARFFDGLFLYGYQLAWDDADHSDFVDPLGRPARTAARDFAWLRTCLVRNAHWHRQDRVVAKLFSMAFRPVAALEAFPDAKIVYLVRDPLETVPSGMSLVSGTILQRMPISKVAPAVRARYFERLYQASLRLYRGFLDAERAGKLPARSVLIVRYDRLMKDFASEMDRILEFLEVTPDDELRRRVADTAANQARYKSEHRYDLETYGLDRARLLRDFAFVYEAYDLPAPEGSLSGGPTPEGSLSVGPTG
jgi:hypothetical protein